MHPGGAPCQAGAEIVHVGLAVRGSLYRLDASDPVLAPGAVQPANARNPAPAQSRQHNIGARLTLTPTKQHDLWLDVEQGRTWYNNDDGRLGGRDADNIPSKYPGYKDALRFNRDQVAIGHTSRFGFGFVGKQLDAYCDGNRRTLYSWSFRACW